MRTPEGDALRAFLLRFRELYAEHRFGAIYLIQRPRDPVNVQRLLKNFTPQRLEGLAVELFTTKDEWISKTDRGIGILACKASWLDGQLCERAAREVQKKPAGAYTPWVPYHRRKESA